MVKALKKGAPLLSWGGLVGVLLTIFVAGILAFVEVVYKPAPEIETREPLGNILIKSSYDIPFVHRKHLKAQEAVIIYMDEESVRNLHQKPHQPWDRKLHVELLKKLIAEKAKAVVFDVTFFEPGDPKVDAELAAAMKEHGKVAVASYCDVDVVDLRSPRISINDSIFREAASSALCNLNADKGSFVRKFYRFPGNGIEATTLPEKAAELSGYVISEQARQFEWMNYFGPPRYLPWKSYHRVLTKDGTEPGFFKDKTVFVGLQTAAGYTFDQRDDYDTPYTMWNYERMTGVEIHATQFLNLIHGNGLQKASVWTEAALYVFFGVLLGWGLTLVRPLLAVLLAVIVAVLIVWLSFLAFKSNHWWPWLISAGVQVPVALSWAVAFNTVRLRLESKTLENSLALHLSPQRARQLSKQPELLGVVAERIEVSILFSDIANFSTITARMHPEDLFKLLNKYFETAIDCIHKTDGTVIKFIGDAIFAIWNAPLPQENHAKAAVAAALQMRDQLVKFDTAQQSLPLQTRIGLHLGDAFVGNVGSSKRFDYTAIGDNINLASRLEGLNKYLGTMVLGTRDIQRLVEKDFASRFVGHFIFKGIERPVEVHEFVGMPGEGKDWRTAFGEGMFAFQRKNFEGAAAAFKKTIEIRGGEDGPSGFYLAQIEKLLKMELPDSWAGEVRLTDK